MISFLFAVVNSSVCYPRGIHLEAETGSRKRIQGKSVTSEQYPVSQV